MNEVSEIEWLEFLESLDNEIVVSFWKMLLRYNIRIPDTAGKTEEGIVFCWDSSKHHLDIDLLDDKTWEWFYSSRDFCYHDGDENLSVSDEIPSKLLKYLNLVASEPDVA